MRRRRFWPTRPNGLLVGRVESVAGWWTGRSEEPALERLGSVLWFLAVLGVVGVAAAWSVSALCGLPSASPVARTELELLFVGTAGLFQWTPQVALFYLEDTLGAEATLFVIGILLISVAGLLTRMVPLVTAHQRARRRGEPAAR